MNVSYRPGAAEGRAAPALAPRRSRPARALRFVGVTVEQTPADLLGSVVAEGPTRPFLTYYDDATGDRVELSHATFDNWVAKTASLLQDELGAAPGERVAVLLPTHWLGAVWLMATWAAGLVVDLASPQGAEVVVAGPDQLDAAVEAGGRDNVAVELGPLGGRFTTPLPDGFVDYGLEVLAQPDQFHAYTPPGPGDPALVIRSPSSDAVRTMSGKEVVEAAHERAQELGLPEGARILTDANPASASGYLDALLTPLVRRSSVVVVRNADPARHDQRRADERITHSLLGST